MSLHLQIALQRRHVVLEGFQACGGDAADGAWLLALEGFLHLNVARRRQLVNLYAQVAREFCYCLTGCFISFSNSESGLSDSSSGLKKFVIIVAKTLLL